MHILYRAVEHSDMPSCPECDTEIDGDSQFCPKCGTDVRPDAGDRDWISSNEDVATATVSKEYVKNELDIKRAIAAGIMATIVGAVVAFGFSNVGGGIIRVFVYFLITFTSVGYFLYSKQETVKLVVGMGLYITAIWMPLVPIILYAPLVVGSANSNVDLWGFLWVGLYMIIFGFIGTIIGVILVVIGYFIRNHERG